MQVETPARAATALVVACTSVLAAQEPAVFRTGTDVVLAPVSVTDGNGRLTKESGGYTEPLRSPSEIAAAVARICDDLRSQYLLTFEPAHADGSTMRSG